MFEYMTRYYAKCPMEVRLCVMEVRLYVPWKFVYMCDGSSFICAMEARSLYGSCCMRACVMKDV